MLYVQALNCSPEHQVFFRSVGGILEKILPRSLKLLSDLWVVFCELRVVLNVLKNVL